jgi:signal transduction histidine kinase
MASAAQPAIRQRSSIESFLDEYQTIRLYLNVGGILLIAVILLGGWWRAGSPWPFLVALGVMGGHAAWCRLHEIRAPKSMLVVDSTMIGVMVAASTVDPAGLAGTVAFMVILVVFFSEGRWMVGLLVYNALMFTVASLYSTGVTAEAVGAMSGSIFTLGATAVVIYRVRTWLARLDANRSQMVGTVSHELRNNLTGMLGLTDVVLSMPDLAPTEALELIGMAHQQAVDANEIVEDLLTASRLEGAALTFSSEEVDINAEVKGTARRFKGMGTDIEISLADNPPLVWADGLRTRQIVRNLLSNAIRYGGERLTISTRLSGNHLEVVVADDGDGVPAEDESTIFLPYRRSTQGRRDKASIGLGLWICRQLAHGMGGTLEYKRKGGLTEFVLSLPVAGPDGSHANASEAAESERRVAATAPTGRANMSGVLATG